MTTNNNDDNLKFMNEALRVGEMALQLKEVPVGCVIVYNNEIIGCGHNLTNQTKNPTRHAEFEAIDNVIQWCHDQKIEKEKIFSESILYVTCEPCIMCTKALQLCGIKKCIYGCSNDRFGGCGSVIDLTTTQNDKKMEIIKGICENEAIDLLKQFYLCENPFAPQPKSKENRNK
jgi:tRNA-specific adenosine deaminase 2